MLAITQIVVIIGGLAIQDPSIIVQQPYKYDYRLIAKSESSDSFMICNGCKESRGLKKKLVASIKVKTEHIKNPLSLEFETIYFGNGKTNILKSEENKIKKNIHELKILNKDYYIEITGFTSKSGSKKSNNYIAYKRAESVSNLLKHFGVNKKQIKSLGKGSCCYVSKTSKFNRRVEIKIKNNLEDLNEINNKKNVTN